MEFRPVTSEWLILTICNHESWITMQTHTGLLFKRSRIMSLIVYDRFSHRMSDLTITHINVSMEAD